MRNISFVLLAATLCWTTFGCARSQSSPASHDVQPAAQTTDPGAMRTMLQQHAEALANVVMQMPGRDEQRHRQLVADAFAQLEQILPLLQPGDTNGAFDQRLESVRSAQARLRSMSGDMSAEPTINQATRNAQNALADIAWNRFRPSEELSKHLTAGQRYVEQLPLERGAIHRLVTAQALREMSRAILIMADTASSTPAS